MKEIKVGLNVEFPNSKQKAHTIVEDIKKNPPKKIKYGWVYPKKTSNQHIFSHKLTNKFDLLEAFDTPFLTENKWIYQLATTEFALNFSLNKNYYPRKKRIEILKKIIKKGNFKKIIFFSKAGLDSLRSYAKIKDKEILNKANYVYNAVPKIAKTPKKLGDKFRILFIGTAFHLKGGDALVDAFEVLQKKYPFLELEIHSSLMKPNYIKNEIYHPLDHKKTIQKIKSNSSIFNYNSFALSRNQILNKVYPRADLFILPSLQEGCPYAIQEAVAYGIPVISTNCVGAIPEIVENNKNGLIINVQNKMLKDIMKNKRIISKKFQSYLTKEIVNKISYLIENDKIRKQMQKNNIKKANKLFSFKVKNKIMRKIYERSEERRVGKECRSRWSPYH